MELLRSDPNWDFINATSFESQLARGCLPGSPPTIHQSGTEGEKKDAETGGEGRHEKVVVDSNSLPMAVS